MFVPFSNLSAPPPPHIPPPPSLHDLPPAILREVSNYLLPGSVVRGLAAAGPVPLRHLGPSYIKTGRHWLRSTRLVARRSNPSPLRVLECCLVNPNACESRLGFHSAAPLAVIPTAARLPSRSRRRVSQWAHQTAALVQVDER